MLGVQKMQLLSTSSGLMSRHEKYLVVPEQSAPQKSKIQRTAERPDVARSRGARGGIYGIYLDFDVFVAKHDVVIVAFELPSHHFYATVLLCRCHFVLRPILYTVPQSIQPQDNNICPFVPGQTQNPFDSTN